MSHPDQTDVFEADAKADKGDPRRDEASELRERLRELEARHGSAEVVNEDGSAAVVEDAGADTVEAPHAATVAGSEFHFFAPKQTALLAFGLGTANRRNGQMVLATLQRFLQFHLDDDSWDTFMERMSDPQDEWGDDEFGELVNKIVEVAQNSGEAASPKNGPARR